MRMRTMSAWCGVGLAVAAGWFVRSAPAAEGRIWSDDFAAAQAKAVKENKDLLVDFTGSDWCSFCIVLDREVFSKSAFQSKVVESYVPVMVDFPRHKTLAPKTVAQNEKLQEKYGIEGFPTVYLMDAAGRPYARADYQGGGVDAYLATLEAGRKLRQQRDEVMAKAQQVEGVDRARLLDAMLSALAEQGIGIGYEAEVAQVVALAPNNEEGLRGKYGVDVIIHGLNNESLDADVAIKEADALLKFELAPEDRQRVVFLKAQVYAIAKKDVSSALKYFREAKIIAPKSSMAAVIDQMIQHFEASAEPAPKP